MSSKQLNANREFDSNLSNHFPLQNLIHISNYQVQSTSGGGDLKTFLMALFSFEEIQQLMHLEN
jgi:hypothetical protein